MAGLSGCSRDNREPDIKACIAGAQTDASQGRTDYPIPANESAEEKHDRIGGLIASCMEKLGYRHDDRSMNDARCIDDVDYNPYCYITRR